MPTEVPSTDPPIPSEPPPPRQGEGPGLEPPPRGGGAARGTGLSAPPVPALPSQTSLQTAGPAHRAAPGARTDPSRAASPLVWDRAGTGTRGLGTSPRRAPGSVPRAPRRAPGQHEPPGHGRPDPDPHPHRPVRRQLHPAGPGAGQGKVRGGEEVLGEGHGPGVRSQVPAEAAQGRGLPARHHQRDRRAGAGRPQPPRGGSARGLRDARRDRAGAGVRGRRRDLPAVRGGAGRGLHRAGRDPAGAADPARRRLPAPAQRRPPGPEAPEHPPDQQQPPGRHPHRGLRAVAPGGRHAGGARDSGHAGVRGSRGPELRAHQHGHRHVERRGADLRHADGRVAVPGRHQAGDLPEHLAGERAVPTRRLPGHLGPGHRLHPLPARQEPQEAGQGRAVPAAPLAGPSPGPGGGAGVPSAG